MPMTLRRFGQHLLHCGRAAPVLEHVALREAADNLADRAKSYLGEYQSAEGPFPAWAPLAEYTIADRIARGFTPNDPLLRTGEMRDSIGGVVNGRSALVASASQIAFWQEFGTRNMPARAFLGRAVSEIGWPEAQKVIRVSLRPLMQGSP